MTQSLESNTLEGISVFSRPENKMSNLTFQDKDDDSLNFLDDLFSLDSSMLDSETTTSTSLLNDVIEVKSDNCLRAKSSKSEILVKESRMSGLNQAAHFFAHNVNSGNLNGLRKYIDEYFSDECILCTCQNGSCLVAHDQSSMGREAVYKLFAEALIAMPDWVIETQSTSYDPTQNVITSLISSTGTMVKNLVDLTHNQLYNLIRVPSDPDIAATSHEDDSTSSSLSGSNHNSPEIVAPVQNYEFLAQSAWSFYLDQDKHEIIKLTIARKIIDYKTLTRFSPYDQLGNKVDCKPKQRRLKLYGMANLGLRILLRKKIVVAICCE